MIELYVLLAAMLIAALVAIEIKDLLAAAVALGIVGFLVAIMFILLQAPDLAIVQIVVETLTVVFFAAVILRTTNVDVTMTGGLKVSSACSLWLRSDGRWLNCRLSAVLRCLWPESTSHSGWREPARPTSLPQSSWTSGATTHWARQPSCSPRWWVC
jgi:uncharacterized MnhB-related membrane protein